MILMRFVRFLNECGDIGGTSTGWRFLLGYALPILCFIFAVFGCAGKAQYCPRPLEVSAKKKLPLIGYSIQMGAFSNLANAVRLTHSLEREGIDAYYFAHKTGLYKVRFGDFKNKESARSAAERLRKKGIIKEYYIVAPNEYILSHERKSSEKFLRQAIVQRARSFLGLPYRWGGSSPREGFDCSGLAMAVYRLNGLNLPRSSNQQFNAGTPVRIDELSKGDLVFFDTSGREGVSHVGIYEGNGKFIHAPGRGKTIREDFLSNKYYKNRYAGARSYL
ncbi:MAG: C40 family peptidase [Deltaproteobacteria bacterium]|nr:C40 family peptidase [Deltaproteobacteria bacterium]